MLRAPNTGPTEYAANVVIAAGYLRNALDV